MENSDDLFNENGEVITDKYDRLVENHLKHPKWTYYTIDMPHKPPAIENQEEREAIWVDVIDDDNMVCELADKCDYPPDGNAEVAVKVIFDDFTEFYFPMVRKESVFDNVMAEYMPNVARLNEDVTWNGNIENFSIGADEVEEDDPMTVDDMFGESTDDEIDIDIDIEV